MKLKRKDPKTRLLDNVIISAKTGCWEWQRSKVNGYGKMSIGSKADKSTRTVFAHRYSYQVFKGSIPDGIFVFGSNESGSHGKGAARTAHDRFGAKWGAAVGLTGRAYAIPTKNARITKTLSIPEIKVYVDKFILFAEKRPDLKFLITEIGCGLAGLTPEQIAPLFKDAVGIENIYLPQRFIDILK